MVGRATANQRALVLLAPIVSTWGCFVDLPEPRPAGDAAPPASGLSYLQGNGATNDDAADTIASDFPQPNGAGNLIVIAASWGGTNEDDVSTIPSDSAHNTYESVTREWDAMYHQGLGVWYAANVAGGANTVTLGFAPYSTYRRMAIHEYAGVAAMSPLDVYSAQKGSGAAPTTADVTATRDGELVFAAVAQTQPTPNVLLISEGDGFTMRQSLPLLGTEDRFPVSAGPVGASFAFDQPLEYLCQMATFVPAPR